MADVSGPNRSTGPNAPSPVKGGALSPAEQARANAAKAAQSRATAEKAYGDASALKGDGLGVQAAGDIADVGEASGAATTEQLLAPFLALKTQYLAESPKGEIAKAFQAAE